MYKIGERSVIIDYCAEYRDDRFDIEAGVEVKACAEVKKGIEGKN